MVPMVPNRKTYANMCNVSLFTIVYSLFINFFHKKIPAGLCLSHLNEAAGKADKKIVQLTGTIKPK